MDFYGSFYYNIIALSGRGIIMNISKITSFSQSFGIVRRAAAQRAVELAKGDMDKLKDIKRVVEEQKDNRMYDIVPIPRDTIHYMWGNQFVVLPYGLTYTEVPNFGTFAPHIESAGHIATNKKNEDIKYKMTQRQPKEKTPFEIEARKILDMCED